MAFQIQDDLLDLFSQEREAGKSVGRDLDMGTLTLPAINLLQGLAGEERTHAESIIREAMQGQSQRRIRELLCQQGADTSAYRVAQERVDQAKRLLEAIEPGPWRELLSNLADASIDRGT